MDNPIKKISMRDIATELNLSITTVSFVVNGKSKKMSISPATVKKVKDLIKKRGFNPNNAARMLRTGKSKTIGLILEDIGDYFFGNIAKIIEIEAHKNGYNVFFSSTENDNATATDLIYKMRNSSVDGFIITATKGLKDEILKLKKDNIPFVLLDRLLPGIETNYVVLDNYKGAYDLAKHLLNNGYKNIGFISISDGMSQMIDRKKGFMDALSDSKMEIPAKAILEVPYVKIDNNVIATVKKFLAKNGRLDALFFAANYLGVLGIQALQQSNLAIPSDIAVACFGDNELFRLLTPSITVTAQPIREIAIKSIDLLLKVIKNEQKQVKLVGEMVQPVLIVRHSSHKKGKKIENVVSV